MTETHTPLPCPFCGSGPARSQGRGPGQASFSGVEMMADLAGGYRVWCGTCGAEGSPEATEAEALTAWNTRAVNSHHDLIEALRVARKIIGDIDDYMKRPSRGDWGEECGCCMGELLDDDRDAIAKIDETLKELGR